jgi:glycosyltransferase involved in cell wall biosynthesis
MFSIVVPVHNKELYINETIDSIINQTYTNFELILVNDGSTDESAIICEQYALKDIRIKVFHQKNAGVSSARNRGVKEASFAHIAFIDADDYWDAVFLEEMNNLIKEFPDNYIYSAKFAYCKNDKISKGEDFFINTKNDYLQFDLIEKSFLKYRFPMHTSSVIIKKRGIEKLGGFDERIHIFEDYDLFLRIALISKVGYLNKGPYSYYNISVPAESKARGKSPLLSKHWISYMSKFDDFIVSNSKLKILLDKMKLSQLLHYRRNAEYKEQVKIILTKVSKSNYGWKYGVIYLLPPIFSKKLIKTYIYIINFLRNIN